MIYGFFIAAKDRLSLLQTLSLPLSSTVQFLHHNPEILLFMSQYHHRLLPLYQIPQIFPASMPRVPIPCQSPRWSSQLPILLHVKRIACEDYCSNILERSLHRNAARCVARHVMESDALCQLVGRCGEGAPIEVCDGKVFLDVGAAVDVGAVGPEGIFEFRFVTPNFDVCSLRQRPPV
jgi:hypothetical protein